MTDKPKIQCIGGIPLQREEGHAENRLPGDLVCKLADPHHVGCAEDLHLGVEATVRWLETDTLERVSVKDLKKVGEAADETCDFRRAEAARLLVEDIRPLYPGVQGRTGAPLGQDNNYESTDSMCTVGKARADT